jgi:hypothetical protein
MINISYTITDIDNIIPFDSFFTSPPYFIFRPSLSSITQKTKKELDMAKKGAANAVA